MWINCFVHIALNVSGPEWEVPRCEKNGLRVSDQVRHKPGCIATNMARGLKFRI